MSKQKIDSFHTYKTRVRYADTDQMGIAHHARYFEWFESARTDMIRLSGTSYSDLEKLGFHLPVIEGNCRYIQPVHYDDLMHIQTSITVISRLKIKVNYRLFIDNDKYMHSEGYTVHCFMNHEGKPVRATEAIINLFRSLPGE